MNPPIMTMGAFLNIVDGLGRILCVRQAYGKQLWTTPGGRIEAGENPLEAALRETVEEVGIVFTTAEFNAVFWKTYANDIVFSFTARLPDHEMRFVPNAEISEAGFFAPDALPGPMAFNTSVRIKAAVAPADFARRLFIFGDPETYMAF
ncbi:MAG: NUDIX hydrolase [Telluria sp.]